jgi:hypothetical protein
LGFNSPGIQIEGYIPINFGANLWADRWDVTKIYATMPRGKLKLIFSEIYLYGSFQDWVMDWQP